MGTAPDSNFDQRNFELLTINEIDRAAFLVGEDTSR